MGFSFGFGSSSNKNSYSGTDTYDKTSNTTTAPTNPDWVNSAGQGLWNGASNLAAANPQSYVAGPNQLQYTGQANAQNMTADGWNFDTDAAVTRDLAAQTAPTTQGATANGYVGNYLNPYLSNVVDASMADFDANAGQTRAQQQLALTKSGAFGGSGSALTIGQTEGQLARARATTDSGLRSQAYDTALTNAQQDAQRQQGANNQNAQMVLQNRDQQLAAAKNLGDLSAQQVATQAQVAGTQSTIGDQMRQIQQQQAQAPLDLQSWLASQFSGLPTDLWHGTTANTTEAGTENQSGNSKGKSTSASFGFGSK